MYLTSYDALHKALDERSAKREEITERRMHFLRMVYGTHSTVKLPPLFPAALTASKPIGILARQIASVCMEDVSFELAAKQLGVVPYTLTFTRDAFTNSNHDKRHRVLLPWMHWTKSGLKTLNYERLVEVSVKELEAVPLSAIRCTSGKNLPLHHRELRAAAMLSGVVYDVSAWHYVMLHESRHRPEFVFRIRDGRETKAAITPDSVLEKTDRPPSAWYYPYYLSWFLDGTMVLFETYDNPIGDVSHAKKLFEASMERIRLETGFLPLVVKIPALSLEMLRCNRHLLWRHDALARLEECAAREPTEDTVALFERIAHAVTEFR